MKLAILDSNIKATIAILTALIEAGLADGDKYYITDVGELNVYVFNKLATVGDFQADDAADATGWWIKDNRYIKSLFYAVADGYDFGSNNATDISSIDNWGRAGKYLLTITDARNEIDILITAKTFAACTASEKIVASEWFVVDKTDRDTVHDANEQSINARYCVSDFMLKVNNDEIQSLTDMVKDSDAVAAGRIFNIGPYRTLWISAGAFAPRQTNGAEVQTEEYATNDINLDQYLFDGVTEEGIQAQISMPDEWDK